MKCMLVQWWLEEYLEGRLGGWRLRWVGRHLQACVRCAEELNWRRSLSEALKPAVSAPCSDEMWQDFLSRLTVRQHRSPQVWRRSIPWWSWGAAAAVMVLAAAMVQLRVAPRQEEAPVLPLIVQRLPAEPSPQSREEPKLAAQSPSSATQKVVLAPRPKPARPLRSPRPLEVSLPSSQSVVYAEVRDESGELVARLLLQTDYDPSGYPTAVQIEYSAPTATEVSADEQPEEIPVEFSPDPEHSFLDARPDRAAARLGIPD